MRPWRQAIQTVFTNCARYGPLKLRKRAQNNADGGLGLRREVAINQVVRLQFPDQIEFEVIEANLDLAFFIIPELGGKQFQLFPQSFSFGIGRGFRLQKLKAGQEI
jgi:hypothetical protein